MSESVYFLTIGLPLATLLLIFGMKYFAAIQQARARRENDDAYRQLSEKAVDAQAQVADGLAAINGVLADLNTRLATLERILKEVE